MRGKREAKDTGGRESGKFSCRGEWGGNRQTFGFGAPPPGGGG